MVECKTHLSAITAINAAIDFEQLNRNKEAYEKYAEGLSLIGDILKNEINWLGNEQVSNRHKHLLEFAKKSTKRLLVILKDTNFSSDSENFDKSKSDSTYLRLSDSLPGIVTDLPLVPLNFPDEAPGFKSAAEEDNKRIIRMYERRIESLIDTSAKANLQLELQRRLAENDALAKRRYELWEKQRQVLAQECQRIAEEKFYIPEKIKSGTVKETDFTKQNLYAACLQYHKEHKWAQDSSCKLWENIGDENYIRKILSYFLRHESHPLACAILQFQQKVVNKLSKLHTKQVAYNKSEENVLEEHFTNIVFDSKEDLFLLRTVVTALWEPLNAEANQLVVLDVLHRSYFLAAKPHFILLLRVILQRQESELQRIMMRTSMKMISYPPSLHSIINRLHLLSSIHSPNEMMAALVEILRSLVSTGCGRESNGVMEPLSVSLDDIMPHLIQLILISNMPTLPAEISFVENFMPATKALGEEGYAVTLFQSVLSFMEEKSDTLVMD